MPNDSLRLLRRYSLPSTENCRNRTESLQQFATLQTFRLVERSPGHIALSSCQCCMTVTFLGVSSFHTQPILLNSDVHVMAAFAFRIVFCACVRVYVCVCVTRIVVCCTNTLILCCLCFSVTVEDSFDPHQVAIEVIK